MGTRRDRVTAELSWALELWYGADHHHDPQSSEKRMPCSHFRGATAELYWHQWISIQRRDRES